MSNTDNNTHADCTISEACNLIELVIEPRLKDLGGFSVRRVLPVAPKRMVGPWIFFDHMGPAEFASGDGINVRPHPHINLATVTYLFEGEILHRDSIGSLQTIKPGDINLMVAGRGITHSERTSDEVKNTGQRLHALQLWLALPEKNEEMEPEFHHYPSDSIPTVIIDDVPIRVMMGSIYGVISPVKTFARTFYAEAHLQPGQTITIPNDEERAVYIAKGSLTTGSATLSEYTMAVFKKRIGIALTALEECKIAIIGGESMRERYIDWNFVSSRKERIEKAKDDWRGNQFPTVVGDEEEFIPLPE
ncbi:MAG: pirin family protein [Cellvibrionaceae bacterium]